MKQLIHPSDPHKMNWIEGNREWGTVKGLPHGVKVEVESVPDGDCVRERYTFTNETNRYLFTSRDTLGIYVPFNDSYDATDICLYNRCHTHIFCGEDVSYVMALRMGGEAPHLGLVLTEGSLCGYSVERDLSQISNDRGDFIIHPSPVQMWAPGESITIAWTLFWHNGVEDFYRQLPLHNPRYIGVEAERYVLFRGETSPVTVTPAFSFEEGDLHVTCNGEDVAVAVKDGKVTFVANGDEVGEKLYRITVSGITTVCRLLVQPEIRELAAARCRFIARRQQISAEGTQPDGAYVLYDNEEEHTYLSPNPDLCAGRERTGMGALMARYLQKHPDAALEASLLRYKAFLGRELVDAESGEVFHDYGRQSPFVRLYNYPWMAVCYLEFYRLWGDAADVLCAYRILKRFYEQNGAHFYPICLPITDMLEALQKEGFSSEYADILHCFTTHGETILSRGIHYPPSEVKFEQSIVAPAADVLCQLFRATGDDRYLTDAAKHLGMLEMFNGRQPDWHLYETAIRHWDGFWFGKRRLYGDTFPHYWSALTARCYEAYAGITGDARYLTRAEASYRSVLGMIMPDGRASCAYLFPITVNGQRGEYFDPYANDQDWGLYFYLVHQDGGFPAGSAR